MERAAGWFVILAALLLVAGLAYYLKVMAERKGWGIQKINYETSLMSAAGLKEGDPVLLMGKNVGEITAIIPNKPTDYYGITVSFWIKKPNYGYIWSDSVVKVSSDIFGKRVLEVTKGVQGVPTILELTNRVADGMLKRNYFVQKLAELDPRGTNTQNALWQLNAAAVENSEEFYADLEDDSIYWLKPAEAVAVNERLEKLVSQVELALPNILDLTNRIALVLDDASRVSINANDLLTTLLPVATNVAVITENIRDPHGSLGEWLLPTNINRQLEGTLTGANTNLPIVVEDLDKTLENLANITSNLNAQVQANSNMLGGIAKTIADADDFVQGLKRHWLLRSAFKNNPTYSPVPPPSSRGPFDK